MKKILIIFLVLIIVFLTDRTISKQEPAEDLSAPNETEISPILQVGTRSCYIREVAATAESPYATSERIELVYGNNNTVTGKKSGTQSGPGMMNGYEGTLSGTFDGKILSVIFTYTIEGSKQKEQEIYLWPWSVPEIIKYRYPLIERGGVLTPDTTKPFTEQAYDWVDCV